MTSYIQEFHGKTFVIKCGGASMTELAHTQCLMQDIALLHLCGIKVVVVHGGGPEITACCDKLGLPTRFSQGQRVTDKATMEVVQMVLAGKINPTLVSMLNQQGVSAVGISGLDATLIKARPFQADNGESLGFVGDVESVNTQVIITLLEAHYLPVISPMGIDDHGNAYNINGDIAAAHIAAALGAEKLVIMTNVNGIYQDVNEPTSLVSRVTMSTVRQWLCDRVMTGGIIPKLQAALHALSTGVGATHILNGTLPHQLLLEIFTEQGVGTLISPA